MTQLVLIPAEHLIAHAFWMEVTAENAIARAGTEAEAQMIGRWAERERAEYERVIRDQLSFGI